MIVIDAPGVSICRTKRSVVAEVYWHCPLDDCGYADCVEFDNEEKLVLLVARPARGIDAVRRINRRRIKVRSVREVLDRHGLITHRDLKKRQRRSKDVSRSKAR